MADNKTNEGCCHGEDDVKLPSKAFLIFKFLGGFADQPGICLTPSFYMPETEDLRWATHNGIRKTLFFAAFRNIKYVEFKRL